MSEAESSVRVFAGAAATSSAQRDNASVSEGRTASSNAFARVGPMLRCRRRIRYHATSSWELSSRRAARHEVLHVRGFEESEAAVLAIGDLSDRELNFDKVAVMTGPHEHGLLAKLNPGLVGRQYALDDRPSFRRGVVAAVEGRL